MNRENRRRIQRQNRAKEVKPIYKNGRTYVNLEANDGTIHTCRLDKICWTTFVDKSLDYTDDSWELGYKDGNYKNCAVDNLYRVQ